MFLKSYLEKILRKEKGAIIVMTAIALPLLLGIAGLGYDVGNLYLEKGKLQHIADASALAGAAVYRDYATGASSGGIAADSTNDVTNDYTLTRPAGLETNSYHGVADSAAWDYVDKNKGNRSISVNGPYALEGTVSAQTSEGAVNVDGVYYRVRLSENVPLYFLPLVPGIGNRQTVEAESIVAVSTDSGTQATTTVYSNTEYLPIFDKLFTYNDNSANPSTVPAGIADDLINPVTDQINLRLYAYMLYMNHQWVQSSTSTSLTGLTANGSNEQYEQRWVEGHNEERWVEGHNDRQWVDGHWEGWRWVSGHYETVWVPGHNETVWVPGYYERVKVADTTFGLNPYYNSRSSSGAPGYTGSETHNMYGVYINQKKDERIFENIKLTSEAAVTINIDSDLTNPYYYYNGTNYKYSGGNYYKYTSNWNPRRNGEDTVGDYTFSTSSGNSNTLSTTNKKDAFMVPLYIYREADNRNTQINDTTFNVTGNSNQSCIPIVLYQYNKFNPAETTVTINISEGKIFRGVIYAPDSHVVINNANGTFEGSIISKRVTTNGTGTYRQKNFFMNENGVHDEWNTNYLGLNYNADGSISYYNSSGERVTYNQDQLDTMLYGNNTTSTWTDWWGNVHTETQEDTTSFEYQLKNYTTSVAQYNQYGEFTGQYKNQTWYDSLKNGYTFFSQEWFEHLIPEQKARLAYFWKYVYEGNMPWLWAKAASSTYEVVVAGTEAIASLRLINSRTESNPFAGL